MNLLIRLAVALDPLIVRLIELRDVLRLCCLIAQHNRCASLPVVIAFMHTSVHYHLTTRALRNELAWLMFAQGYPFDTALRHVALFAACEAIVEQAFAGLTDAQPIEP